MRLLVGKLKFNYVVSNCVAIVVCSLLNFLLGDRFVFEAKPESEAIPT
jgi:putative flippase GtrA